VRPDIFKASLDPSLFRIYRRYLYSRYKATDELALPEVVHEIAKDKLLRMAGKFRDNADYFDPGSQLNVKVGRHVLNGPVGVAAGFDKDCEILTPMSYVFGFLNPGSVLRDARPGNPQRPRSKRTVRITVDNEREAIVNAQGYPHKGLDNVVENLDKFTSGPRGRGKVLLNFSGISDAYTEDSTLDSCREIISRTSPYVDFGFEESRTSPNTDFNRVLETPDFTRKIIDLMNSHVPSGLVKASKISPYSSLTPSEEERENKLKCVRVFHENGGDMVVLGNTRFVPTKGLVPRFERDHAGESGRPLFPYMLKLVEDVHTKFPDLAIVACGGIFSGEDARQAHEKRATLVSLYNDLTFRGFGLVKEIHDYLIKKLAGDSLEAYLERRDSRL